MNAFFATPRPPAEVIAPVETEDESVLEEAANVRELSAAVNAALVPVMAPENHFLYFFFTR